MKKEIKSELDEIFRNHEISKLAVKKGSEKREDAFLKEFKRTRDGIIKSAMEELGEYLKAWDIDYEIHCQEDIPALDTETQAKSASIEITFYPERKKLSREKYPCFSVTCEEWHNKVQLRERINIGGNLIPVGEININELSTEMIQKKIKNVLVQFIS